MVRNHPESICSSLRDLPWPPDRRSSPPRGAGGATRGAPTTLKINFVLVIRFVTQGTMDCPSLLLTDELILK